MEEFILFYSTNIEAEDEWYHRKCNSIEHIKNEVSDLRNLVDGFPIRFEVYKKVEIEL